MKTFRNTFLILFFFGTCNLLIAGDTTQVQQRQDYQIYLKQPAKTIKLLMYEKNFLPIQGKLSDDRKSVIMKDYQGGNRVHVKVIYDDGTEDEFVKSPCYIDPVIL
jgi:hypothetical protein